MNILGIFIVLVVINGIGAFLVWRTYNNPAVDVKKALRLMGCMFLFNALVLSIILLVVVIVVAEEIQPSPNQVTPTLTHQYANVKGKPVLPRFPFFDCLEN